MTMMMRPLRLSSLVLIGAVLAVCITATDVAAKRDKKKRKLYDCEANFEKAKERYEREWYNDVVSILEDVQFQCGGHQLNDSVHYMLGMAHMQLEHSADAKSQFRRLVDNFPNSPVYEEAQYRIGQSTYLGSNQFDRDQTDTHQAIRELSDFVSRYPQSAWADSARSALDACREKLARKDYSTARFYHRIDKLDAAAVYYRSVLTEYGESKYAAESRLYLAQALAQTNRVTEAADVIDELIDGQYSEDIKQRARQLRTRLNEG